MDSEFCYKLPKLELHAHLNGSLNLYTLQKLYNLSFGLGDHEEKLSMLNYQLASLGQSQTLSECFKLFDIAHNVTKNTEAVKIATQDVIEDFAQDNVLYLELRSTLRDEVRMSKRDYLSSMIQGVLEARKTTPSIVVKLIISINRGNSVEDGTENVDIALEFKRNYSDIVVGVDLSGNPSKGNFNDFKVALQKARLGGLKVVLHCGEVVNEDEMLAMIGWRPDRLGHCTCCHVELGGNDTVWNALIASKIPVEVCLSSNVQCGTVPTVDKHHFQYLWSAKHPVAISTDDKGVFNTTLSKEFQILQQTFHLDNFNIWKLSLNAVDHTFVTPAEKLKLKEQLMEWWIKNGEDFN